MKPVPHTIQKNRTYHFKRRVPADVQNHPEFGGKQFVQFSLRTKERSDAVREAALASEQFESKVRRARGSGRKSAQSPFMDLAYEDRSDSLPKQIIDMMAIESVADFSTRYERHNDSQLLQADQSSSQPSETFMGFAGGITVETWSARLKELENEPRNPDTIAKARRSLAKFGFTVNEESEDFGRLCYAMSAAETEAISELLNKPVINPKYACAGHQSKYTSSSSFTVSDAADLYRRINSDKTAMLKKLKVATRAWTQLVGKEYFQMITKGDVHEFVDALKSVPTNASERFPRHTLKEAIRLNDDRASPYPTLSMKTIKAGYLSPLQTIARIAHERENIQSNPFFDLRIRGGTTPGARRRAFTVSELNHIFEHPIYSGCASIHRRNSPGDRIVRDHYFWPAPIALFTGLRAEEIANLRTDDFKLNEAGYPPHIHVRGTKTRAADRHVPIHPNLFEIGLVDFVRCQQQSKHSLLFPAWQVSAGKSKSSGRPIRNFNEKVVDHNLFKPPVPTFHCFRQTLRTELERAGLQDGIRKVVMGHKLEGMDGHYLKLTILDTYKPFCDAVRYVGLDLEKFMRR